MSKIGRVNLELQEEANELGYDTVQEAIADGWEANEIAATLTKKDELEEAHEAQLKEQAEKLGFETVQKALDDGYIVVAEPFGDGPMLYKLISPEEQAHKEWLKERECVLEKLHRIRQFLLHYGWEDRFKDELFEIEAFIRRGEV